MIERFLRSEKGQGFVEYGLILALVSSVVLGSLGGVGDSVNSNFDKVSNTEITSKVQEGYIPIANAEELDSIRDGSTQTFGKGSSWEGTYTSGLDKNYIQVSDINLSRKDWEPIDEFTGIYEGSGMNIKNLKIDNDSYKSNGLFGEVQGALLKDINLVDVSIQGTDAVGGLVGSATQASELDSVYVSGVIRHSGSNEGSTGGVVGEMSNKSKLSYSSVNVSVGGQDNVGGLVGSLQESEIHQSYAHGSLTAKDSSGGLVGSAGSNSIVDESYANVEMAGEGPSIGGIVGVDKGVNVENSHWDVNTSGVRETAGGKGKGQSSYEMTLARTFKGWDFEDVWKIEEGQFYPIFEGENTRLDEVKVTFVISEDEEYTLTGITGWTLIDFYEGEAPPKPINHGSTLVGWITESGDPFDMDSILGDKDLRVSPNWVLNEIVTKTFDLSEEKNQDQVKDITVNNLHELISYDVDRGKVDLLNRNGDVLEFKLSNRPYNRRVLTGGKETLADSKNVTAQGSANYNLDDYKGTLDRYVYSGVYTPTDTKSVSAQTSSNYNSGGYSGSLSSYLYSGSSSDSKYVSGQTSSSYNSGGYSGSLSSYVSSGSYTSSDTKYVSGQSSSSYNSGGYRGSLSRYVSSGSAADSKYVSGQSSSYYNSGGYSGSLSSYVSSGSYTSSDSKYVSGETSSYYNSGGYSGSLDRYVSSGSYSPGDSRYVTGQTSSYYNSGGYSGSLSSYVHSGSVSSSESRTEFAGWYGSYVATGYVADRPPSSRSYSYNGFSGTLHLYQTETQYTKDTTGGSTSGELYRYIGHYRGTVTKPGSDSRVYRYQGTVYSSGHDTRVYRYRGYVSRPESDTRVYRYQGTVNKPDTRVYRYSGNVTRPASDTRVYRYQGTVNRPDTRVYRYKGDVTKPTSDTRVYRYRGEVNRPYSDTRTWDHFYKYVVTLSYRPK